MSIAEAESPQTLATPETPEVTDVTSGPPATEAGGILTVDLAALFAAFVTLIFQA